MFGKHGAIDCWELSNLWMKTLPPLEVNIKHLYYTLTLLSMNLTHLTIQTKVEEEGLLVQALCTTRQIVSYIFF